jgi:heat shock protein HslJ
LVVLSWRSAALTITYLIFGIAVAGAQTEASKQASGSGSAKSARQPGSQAEAAPSLENTYWVLTKVGETVVPESHSPRRAHLILNAEAHRVGGSGGCNGILGRYEVTGDQLTFTGVAMTRMACKQGMETEQVFLTALNQVKGWKITGRKLELQDGEWRTVAEFETGPTRK